jgi:hypothetical protein
VDAKLAVSSPATASATPAAYRQRTSKANRSAASRSDRPPGVAGPSPPPGSTAAPSGARSAGTGRRTAPPGTTWPAPGPGTGTPTPPAALPHTSGHQQWADPGGGADGQGSRGGSSGRDRGSDARESHPSEEQGQTGHTTAAT